MTAAFLGAAYAAGFVLAVASLREHDWSRIRVALLTVIAFTWLTAIATVVHLHKLLLLTGGPFARAVAWVWLAVYLVIPLACVAVVAGQELRRVGADVVVRPMPAWLTVLLGAQGLVLFTVGVLLFGSGMTVHHGEPRAAAAFWPWALMPLGAQVIGAWLMALGVAAALAIRQRDLSRLLVSAMTYTTFGVCQFVAVFWHWSQFSRRDHWLWAYLMVLVVIVLTGAYGWWPRGGRPAIRSWPRRAGSPPRRPPAGARTAQAEAARGRSGHLRCAAAVLLADELDEGIQVPRRTVRPPGEPHRHRRGVPDAVDDARAGDAGQR